MTHAIPQPPLVSFHTADDVVATPSSPFFHPQKRARWLEEGPLADVASTSPPAHIEDTPGKHVTSSIEPFAESPPVTMATSFVDSSSFDNPLLSINCCSHLFFLYQQCHLRAPSSACDRNFSYNSFLRFLLAFFGHPRLLLLATSNILQTRAHFKRSRCSHPSTCYGCILIEFCCGCRHFQL